VAIDLPAVTQFKLSLSVKLHCRGSPADASTSTVRMVFYSHRSAFCFGRSGYTFHGTGFSLQFQKFANFCVQVYGLGLGFMFRG